MHAGQINSTARGARTGRPHGVRRFTPLAIIRTSVYMPTYPGRSARPCLHFCRWALRDGTQIGRQDHMAKCPTQDVRRYGGRLARKTNRPLGCGTVPLFILFSRAHARSDRRPGDGETRCAKARVSQTCTSTAGIHHERVRIQADKGLREAPIGFLGGRQKKNESNGTDPRRTGWRPWHVPWLRQLTASGGSASSPNALVARQPGSRVRSRRKDCAVLMRRRLTDMQMTLSRSTGERVFVGCLDLGAYAPPVSCPAAVEKAKGGGIQGLGGSHSAREGPAIGSHSQSLRRVFMTFRRLVSYIN